MLPLLTTTRVTTTTATMGAQLDRTVITLRPLLLIPPCTPQILTGPTGAMEAITEEATETPTDALKVATGPSVGVIFF